MPAHTPIVRATFPGFALAVSLFIAALTLAIGCQQPPEEDDVVDPESASAEILKGRACGDKVCGSDEFCCNASCGICAEKGGACTLQFCSRPKPKGIACKASWECQVVADYCNGCSCKVSGTETASCSNTPVACLRDPCGGLRGACGKDGFCKVVSDAPFDR